MTYRDFTQKQVSRFQRQCQKSMEQFMKAYPSETVSPVQWKMCWSRAFIAGVNHLETRYRSATLWDDEEIETLRKRVAELEKEKKA